MRESNSGRMGTLTHEFDVPEPSGLRVTSPILGDALDREGKQVVPSTRRTFAPSGTLHCQYEVLGGAPDPETGQPKVSAGWVLREISTSRQWTGPVTLIKVQPDGRVLRRIGVPLDGLDPGRYDLTLVVQDRVSGKAVASTQAFTLAPTE